jgi:hypothetical protein
MHPETVGIYDVRDMLKTKNENEPKEDIQYTTHEHINNTYQTEHIVLEDFIFYFSV